MKRILSMLAIMSAVLVSCQKSEISDDSNNGNQPIEPEYEISISPDALTFGAAGGDQTITVTSSEDWYLDGKSDWCEVSASYGSNGDKVTFTADSYDNTKEARTATFTFYCGDKDIDLVVTQEAKVYSISVKPDELSFEAIGGEKEVSIVSSDSWSFTSEEDWITVSEQSGRSGNVKIIVSPNDNPEIRTGAATFRCGDKKVDVPISQEAKVFSISIDPPEIEIDVDGQEQKITVTSSDNWSVSKKDSWISVSSNQGENGDEVMISASFNTNEARAGSVIFKCGNQVAELAVVQKADESPIIRFKDPYFLKAILKNKHIDRNGDGQISESEAFSTTTLTISGVDNKIRNIDELSQYFVSLQSIYFGAKIFDETEVTFVDLSNSLKLKEFSAFRNDIDIDLSNCVNLESFALETCTSKLLNLSGCTSLKKVNFLTLGYNGYYISVSISTINLSGCSSLTGFSCGGADVISLDASGCSSLTDLNCYSNQLTSLDVSGCSSLTSLVCYGNQLASLDVSGCSSLTSLDCRFNVLTDLDLSKNTVLTSLDCYSNQLTSLDLSKNTALTSLDCSSNQLTSLDLSKNTALTSLNCYSNQLTSLDLSKNTVLTSLDCHRNELISLDLSKNTALTSLNCYSNQLTSLDLSKNTALTRLECEFNRLARIILYRYHIIKDQYIKTIINTYGDIIEYVE